MTLLMQYIESVVSHISRVTVLPLNCQYTRNQIPKICNVTKTRNGKKKH